MAIEEFGTAFVALATALVLYAIGWVLVRNARPGWKWTWRTVMLGLFFLPALYLVFGSTLEKRAERPPSRSVTEAPKTAPPPPVITAEPQPGGGRPARTEPRKSVDANEPVAGGAPPAATPRDQPVRRTDEGGSGTADRTIATTPAPAAGASPPPTPRAAAPEPSTGASPPPVVATAPPPSPAMRAPAPVSAPPAAARKADDPRWDVVPVFYGTDRGRSTRGQRIIYTSDRAQRLELGRAEITVPKAHEVPNVERPWAIRVPFTSITLYEQPEDPAKHFTVREIKNLTEEEFLSSVRARLASSRTFENHALVFIHGYNTDFDFAIYRTAQIAYDLKFDGAPFMYSWPAASGVASYVYDRDSADIAEPYLRQFLELVVRQTGAKNVSIIAHSMGNRPLLRVLRDLGPRLPEGVKLDQVIFASPDVDSALFAQLAEAIPRFSRGVTLYASSNDRAMSASRLVGGAPRAGDITADGPTLVAGIDTIDVSSTSTDWLALNHSLFAERTTLIDDIARLLQTGQRPPDTRLPALIKVPTPRGDYWRFP